MTKIYKFKVYINRLESKIWREIEIPSSRNVSDLAYSILATFNSLAYHLYNITINNIQYDCGIEIDMTLDYFASLTPEEHALFHNNVILKEATKIKLKDINFKVNEKYEMEYDFGSTTTFFIEYIEEKEFLRNTQAKYPLITAGAGAGMLDDMTDDELTEIVHETDKLGYSKFYYTPGYRWEKYFDYRNFDLAKNQLQVRRTYHKIKDGYEGNYID